MTLRSKIQNTIGRKERKRLIVIGIHHPWQKLQRRPSLIGFARNIQVKPRLHVVAIRTYKSNSIKHIYEVYIPIVLVVSLAEKIGLNNKIAVKNLSPVGKMEITPLDLTVGQYLQGKRLLPQRPGLVSLFHKHFHLGNLRRPTFGSLNKIVPVSRIVSY